MVRVGKQKGKQKDNMTFHKSTRAFKVRPSIRVLKVNLRRYGGAGLLLAGWLADGAPDSRTTTHYIIHYTSGKSAENIAAVPK